MLMIKMELACVSVLLYIIFYYFKIKRLRIKSAAIYKAMLFVGLTNLIFDGITVYTVNHLEEVSAVLNRLFHQIFIGSLDLLIFLICYYILSIVKGENPLTIKRSVLLGIPLLVSFFMVLFAPLYYETRFDIAYSYGPMANTCYISVGIYLVLSLIYIIKYWKKIPKKQREAILPVLLIMVLISLYQLFNPTFLISGIGVILILLGIFMALENPAEYLTNTGKLFNYKAFSIVIDDWIQRNKTFSVIAIIYTEGMMLEEKYKKEGFNNLILSLDKYVLEKFSLELYHPMDGCFMLLIPDEKKVNAVMDALKERFSRGWMVEGKLIKTEANICSFALPSEYKTREKLIDAITWHTENSQWNVIYMDRNLGIKNRNGFERSCNFVFSNRKQFTSLWYLMIDVNDLKGMNDSLGHLAGDRLLQDCADVLTGAVEDNVDVYRIGGDEFAILLVSKTEEQIQTLLEKIEIGRNLCNQKREIPLSFAIGYSCYDEHIDSSLASMIERADQKMYEAKAKMKENRGCEAN